MLKGITVTLYEKTKTGTDAFNEDVFEETAVQVDDVLVAPAQSQEILDTINLYGKKAVYTLAIPKDDEHDWKDKRVSFFGKDFRTFGEPLQGISCDIPLRWNMKVMVELYE